MKKRRAVIFSAVLGAVLLLTVCFVLTSCVLQRVQEDVTVGDKKEKTPVILEVLPQNNAQHRFCSFNAYVPTQSMEDGYYVRYCFVYEYSDVRNNFAANTSTNLDNYRVKTAQLVKIDSIQAGAVTATDVFEVLQQGEISLAMQARGAADFIGGYHGDERLDAGKLSLVADGEEVSLSAQSEPCIMYCDEIVFSQTTTMYEWNTSTAETFGRAVATHTQAFTIDEDGIKNRQTITWLCDDFQINQAFFQMFTMKRISNGKTVCEVFEVFDKDGNSLGKQTTAPNQTQESDKNLLTSVGQKVEYTSATSGVSAVCGFNIPNTGNNGLALKESYVKIRAAQGDNKWYVAFQSAQHGVTPAQEEVWVIDAYYDIDYAFAGN